MFLEAQGRWTVAVGVAFLAGGDPLANGLSFDLGLEFGEHTEHLKQGALIRIFLVGADNESFFNDVQLDACLVKAVDGPPSKIIEPEFDHGTVTYLESQLGDVLGDGQVSAADATVIQRYIAGLEIPVDPERVETYGDITQTGEVTSADVVAALQIVVDPAVEPPAPDELLEGTVTPDDGHEIVVTTGPTEVFDGLGTVGVVDDTEGFQDD